MGIEIRTLLATEGKVYRKIRLESLQKFPDSFSANYHEAIKTEKLGLEKDIEDQTFEKFVYGAFSDDELIGICAFVKNEMNIGTIYQMYIRENFQGKNMGLRLVGGVIKEAGIRYDRIDIYLEVARDNFKAHGLYRKVGFEVVNENENNQPCLMKYNAKTVVR